MDDALVLAVCVLQLPGALNSRLIRLLSSFDSQPQLLLSSLTFCFRHDRLQTTRNQPKDTSVRSQTNQTQSRRQKRRKNVANHDNSVFGKNGAEGETLLQNYTGNMAIQAEFASTCAIVTSERFESKLDELPENYAKKRSACRETGNLLVIGEKLYFALACVFCDAKFCCVFELMRSSGIFGFEPDSH